MTLLAKPTAFCFLLALLLSDDGECARILGVVPTPSYSHQVIFRPIWRELHRRGHHLTVLTTDPENDPDLKNITEIDLHGAYDFWHVDRITEDNNKYNIIKETDRMLKMMDDVTDFEYGHPEVQALLKNRSERFDLVIVEFLMPTVVAFAARFHCPFVGVTSLDAHYLAHDLMGNPTSPILYPEFQMPFIPPMNFVERVVSVVIRGFIEIYAKFAIQPGENVVVEKHFGKGYPPVRAIAHNMSMLFVNTNPAVHTIRPLGPATVQIGGGAHFTPPKPLPKDLKTFLDDANGAIYFSLGTNVKSASVDEKLKRIFIDVLGKLPYRVLWKFDEDLENLPGNMKIIKWGPQQDILRHPSIKLFISQGGLQSTEEALHSHVPMVVVPFFGDQVSNAKTIVAKGFGVMLDKDTLTADVFRDTIKEVIGNPKFKQNAKKYAQLSLDQPMNGTEKAVWWIEYVIRHNGAMYLKGHAHKVPMYQYFCLDVIVFLILALTIPVLIVCKLIRLLLGMSVKKTKIKSN